jgi:hypothetical protein
METIPMKRYCPRSKYPLTAQELILFVTQIEDELNEEYKPQSLPKYEKKELKITPAFIVAFAGNMVRSILP